MVRLGIEAQAPDACTLGKVHVVAVDGVLARFTRIHDTCVTKLFVSRQSEREISLNFEPSPGTREEAIDVLLHAPSGWRVRQVRETVDRE